MRQPSVKAPKTGRSSELRLHPKAFMQAPKEEAHCNYLGGRIEQLSGGCR